MTKVTRYEIELITPRYPLEVYNEFYTSQASIVEFATKSVDWIESSKQFLKDAFSIKQEINHAEGIECETFDEFARQSYLFRTFNFQEDVKIEMEIKEMVGE